MLADTQAVRNEIKKNNDLRMHTAHEMRRIDNQFHCEQVQCDGLCKLIKYQNRSTLIGDGVGRGISLSYFGRILEQTAN